jgi:hypothetical protein
LLVDAGDLGISPVAGMVRQIAVTFILLKLFSLLCVRERFAKALARHSPRPQTAHGVT